MESNTLMSTHEEDLDLLSLSKNINMVFMSLELTMDLFCAWHDYSGYLSDDGSPRRRKRGADMSVFKDSVRDCLHFEPKLVKQTENLNRSKNPSDSNVEKYSGLRIRNQLVSPTELSERFSGIRFVRLPSMKNLLVGDTLSGCWATVGVLTEKGHPKTSSAGKSYCIWKLGCLDENTVSVFLFGDAYQQNCKEHAGTVFALFNCTVRKDNLSGFSLSLFSSNQILKMGTSIDYGVCKGKRKDGMACTVVINKRQGIYCRYHKSKASERFSTVRTELKGGNLRTAFRDPLKSEGIYLVDPLGDRTNSKKPKQPAKLLTVEGLRRALSNADKVTTNTHSQGIRFLNKITGEQNSKDSKKVSATSNRSVTGSEDRKSYTMKVEPSVHMNKAKRTKTEQMAHSDGKIDLGMGKMIELEIFGSDEEL
ncbi:hypothetical protein K2173_012449 [Erythroxylum novogranatense]|uniref:Zinc finger Mcm10/DnaG-type domain-containing protein n=1 Tax=Erythroxylum novogranatense TaxID=1862640 RepID=A0AAV8TLE6_9ROSI|nr:hypothetical protein K2173_012449 [Erythroxylum novogranatense]